MWVAPFGNLRIKGYLLLPEAYRSLSRPSSAPDAKAFPLRSFQLDLLSLPRPVREIGSLKNYAGFTKIEIVIVTLHPFGCCSTIKICLPRLLTQQPLCCLTSYMSHCSVSRCGFPTSFEVRSKHSIPRMLRFDLKLVEIVGIEPATSCLQGRRSPS